MHNKRLLKFRIVMTYSPLTNRFIQALLCLIVCSNATLVLSAYPHKPVRIIVPSQAGGAADVVARAISQKFYEAMGQQFIVDNRIGPLGAELAARAPADGYTLMFTTATVVIRGSVQQNLAVDLIRDFRPITQTLTQSNVLVANMGLGVRTVAELVALARTRPGQLNYGSGGNATSNHLAGELFKLMAKIYTVHVPYRGIPLAVGDVLAGRVQYMFSSPLSTLPQVKEGRLRLLAVTTPQRSTALPDVPTIAESGLPGFAFTGWMGYFAPIKVAQPIVERIYFEATKALQGAEITKRLQAEASEPVGSRPEAFAVFVKAEVARWSQVARDAKVKAD